MHQLRLLKEATPEQIGQITLLYREAGWWPAAGDDPAHVAGIVRGSYAFVIAEAREGEIAGMGRIISDGVSDSYIQDVAVKHTYRHRGVGSDIILFLVDHLRKNGLAWIGLIAERGTRKFYTRLGFGEMPDSAPMLKTIS